MMPAFPPQRSNLGFLFGTRHGVPEFCQTTLTLWQQGMFERLLVSGGPTGALARPEAEVIGEELVRLGVPASALILETAALHTGENVVFGKRRVDEVMTLAAVRSVLVIGKICSTRRYLMTMQRHWPGLRLSVCRSIISACRPNAGTSTRNFVRACSANSRRFRAICSLDFSKRSQTARDDRA